MRRVGLIDITVGNAARLARRNVPPRDAARRSTIATHRASRRGSPAGSRGFARTVPQSPVAPRRTLLRCVQIALKPASEAPGLRGVFKRGKGRKYLIADSALKRMQVDAPGACWLDADEHHRGLALRTGGALNCSEWNDGREALRLGHDASLEQAGAQHSLSPGVPKRRSGDFVGVRLRDLKRQLIRRSGAIPTSGAISSRCAPPRSRRAIRDEPPPATPSWRFDLKRGSKT